MDLANEWFAGDMWRPVSSAGLNDDVPLQFLFYHCKHLYQNGPGSWANVPEIPQLASDLNNTPPGGILDDYTLLVQVPVAFTKPGGGSF